MNTRGIVVIVIVLLLGSSPTSIAMQHPDWGFFGHKRINRLAVFTLPPEMIVFFKEHIEFLTEHAPDPDRRRYAVPNEEYNHYIDIDVNVGPRTKDLTQDLMTRTDWMQDETKVFVAKEHDWDSQTDITIQTIDGTPIVVSYDDYVAFFRKEAFQIMLGDPMEPSFANQVALTPEDDFTHWGILPYQVPFLYRKLVRALQSKDVARILRYSADIGHYIGDAHVPLHTTENYNGQLTGQDGIHGFWESTIPEAYADTEYDYFVGKAAYVNDIKTYMWDIVADSYSHVDSVLGIEMRIRKSMPEDQLYTYASRGARTMRMPSDKFAKAYNTAMQDMVESRFTASIHAVASVWYSAWVDAGRPDMSEITNTKPIEPDSIKITQESLNLRVHE